MRPIGAMGEADWAVGEADWAVGVADCGCGLGFFTAFLAPSPHRTRRFLSL